MITHKVLLVDDDKDFATRLKESIEKQGLHVASYFSAEQAATALYSGKDYYSFVVCDIRIPFFGYQEGGLEIAKTVSERSPSSFIILISQYVTAKLVNDFMENMPHKRYRFITKSDNIEEDLIDIFKRELAKKYIFVCMSFDPALYDIYDSGIKPTVERIGLICERVDEIQYSSGIIEKVYSQIKSADMIIADITGQNPNVLYEVGYAHALGKEVILITRKVEDIPSDLRNFHCIVHDGQLRILKEKLEKRIRAFFE
ncbi:Nucleoside 2-deoxyribosyltransferase [Candidatus Magnetobacterium bavaricum]|uniref:Nucleoside 2-deoxyribosyltransferase n=1 Tax=Candidatus Magnetobacterium bavaricum TaxID=29290 RepID=A0A0F3GR02_9BACT|nr:Nucleoside 2-deoxyribosyltransferase [Candidatus Magnetobacterium bavaricum]